MLNKVTHFRFLRYKEKVIIIVLVFLYFPAEVKEEKSKHQPRLLFKGTKAPDIFHFKMKGIECN